MGTKSTLIDITGMKFSKLTAVKYLGNSIWECKCDCGKTCSALGKELRNGKRKSCGCLNKEKMSKIGKNNTKHGGYQNGKRTRIYNIWMLMNDRCYSENSPSYKYYGRRGITICDEWNKYNPDGFLNFKNWSLENGYSDGLTIDRINNDKNYEPSNCRWTTMTTQNRNRGKYNNLLEYRGETKCLQEWADIFGVNQATLYDRIKGGWSVERALEEPIHNTTRKQ